jgi:GT2 family glycosyltransferase
MPTNIPSPVSIILLNYNGGQDTIECLESLRVITYPNYRIIAVDNASTDDSFQKLEQYLESNRFHTNIFHSPADAMTSGQPVAKFTLIPSGYNGGYAYGNNIGIKYALKQGTEYVLLLNNDTVVDPSFLEPLVEMCEQDQDVGVVSCKLYYQDRPDVIWFNGGKFHPIIGKVQHVNFNEIETGQEPPEFNTFISGCAMLIPKWIFDAVGFLNEDYFLYVEDLEFSQRVLKAGRHLKICKDSRVWHHVAASTGGAYSALSVYWRARNMNKFIRGNVQGVCGLSGIIIFNLRTLGQLFFAKRMDLISHHAKGMLNGLGNKDA